MSNLDIYRNNAVIASPEIDEQTVYSGEFMGMDKIQASFITREFVDFRIDDYIEHLSAVFKIKDAANCDPSNSFTFKYNLTFYGEIYDLYDVPLAHLGRTKFTYTGTPLDLLGLIVDCLNEWFGGGWSIGEVSDISEPITLTFDEVSCRVALTTIAEQFKLEYSVKQKKLFLTEKIGVVRPITLKYGRGQGLQKLSKQPIDQSYATVWRFYGGNKNIPAGYRNGMDRITTGELYEINTDLYGRKGGSVTFEDVYPQRTSAVETAPDLNRITDSTIDFDINERFITEGSAKIVFKTGALGGSDGFVITSYDHSTKTIRYGSLQQEDTGYTIPSETRYASPGDKYTIIGIEMPEEYVIAAEEEVMRRGKEHANKNSFPPVSFPLIIDEKYIREMGNADMFQAGDSFHVVSESLGVNAALRLQSVSYPLVNQSAITGVISDQIQYTAQERIVKDVKQNKKITTQNQKSAIYARQVADEIANAAIIQQFKRTYVGDRAILTGAIGVGNPIDGLAALLTGAGSVEFDGEGNKIYPIRLAIGDIMEDIENAALKLRHDGSIEATKAFISGVIEALSGKIGNWEIDGSGISSTDGRGYILASREIGGGVIEMRLGSDYINGVDPSTQLGSMTRVATVKNSRDYVNGYNIGIEITVEGSGFRNDAVRATKGDIRLQNGAVVIEGPDSQGVGLNVLNGDVVVQGQTGKTFSLDFRTGGESWYRLTVTNGIITGVENVT